MNFKFGIGDLKFTGYQIPTTNHRPMLTIFTAHWVLPVTAPPLGQGAVAFDGSSIVAVGRLDDVRSRFPQATVRDFGEAAILPGLVNTHSHLELTAFRGRLEEPHFQRWVAELIKLKRERLSDEDLLVSARLGCVEAIRVGVTTLADTADAAAPFEALLESGQRGVIFQECFGPDAAQAEQSVAALRRKVGDYLDRVAEFGVGSRLKVGVSPHAPYSVSAELYRRVASLARDENLEVAIHTAESLDEAKFLKDGTGAFAASLRARGIGFAPPGCSTVEYLARLGVLELKPLLIHCVSVDDADIELLARTGARVAHCPKSNAKFGHGVAPLKALLDAGVNVGLGTDSVASNNTCDLIEEARFAALLHRAASRDAGLFAPDELLRMVTLDGARCLGLERQCGSLEAGKDADLVVVDLARAHAVPHYDPAAAVVWSCSARDVVLTVAAGKILFDGERVTVFDEDEVINSARRVQAKLAPRL
jgi:cytosine/adenosine deaminase-related metal-dependent hydrolase